MMARFFLVVIHHTNIWNFDLNFLNIVTYIRAENSDFICSEV